MRNHSACFILFLTALFIAVPAVATLLIYEIEIINDLPQQPGPVLEDPMLITGSEPFNLVSPETIYAGVKPEEEMPVSDAAPLEAFDLGMSGIHQMSGLFPESPALQNTFDVNWTAVDEPEQYRITESAGSAFSIRLPVFFYGKALIVRFDPDAEIPHSAAMFCIGTGLLGIAGLRRKKYRKRIRRYRKIM